MYDELVNEVIKIVKESIAKTDRLTPYDIFENARYIVPRELGVFDYGFYKLTFIPKNENFVIKFIIRDSDEVEEYEILLECVRSDFKENFPNLLTEKQYFYTDMGYIEYYLVEKVSHDRDSFSSMKLFFRDTNNQKLLNNLIDKYYHLDYDFLEGVIFTCKNRLQYMYNFLDFVSQFAYSHDLHDENWFIENGKVIIVDLG